MNDSKTSPIVPILILAAAAGAAFVTQAFAQTRPIVEGGLMEERSRADLLHNEPKDADGRPKRPNPDDSNDAGSGRPARPQGQAPTAPPTRPAGEWPEQQSEYHESTAEYFAERAAYMEEISGGNREQNREFEQTARDAEVYADDSEY